MNQACLWLLLEELVRLGRVDGNILAAELIGRGKNEVLLLRDIANDAWVYAARCGDLTIPDTIERGLQMVRQATGNSPACLLVEKNLEARLEVETLAARFVRTIPAEQVRVLSRPSGDDELPSVWTAGAGNLPQQVKEMLGLYLSRRRPAAKELAYFSLTDREPAIVADEDFDLVWSLVARALMKEFAHRLMNFGWSSAEYLAQNFLEGSSTLVVESGRVDVRLARVPLHIMLRIAGLDEQSYTVPWLNDTQVTLSLMPE